MGGTPTTMNVYFDLAEKSVTVDEVIAIREVAIVVNIIDGSAYVNDLCMKIQNIGNKGETTPIGSLSVFTTSGSNARGVLNLNTTEAISEFADADNTEVRTYNILLLDTTNGFQLANGTIRVKNNPTPSDDAPITLSQATQLSGKVNYSDFSSVEDLSSFSSSAENRQKINEILAILRNDS